MSLPDGPRTALLLVNLGTPASPRPADVRRYLREFLSDPRVIDLPAWRRWLLLNFLILPLRPRRSGAAYSQIWTDQGSPLLVNSLELASAVRARLAGTAIVELAMRYGEPSIRRTLAGLERRGLERLVVFPLYPQYSSAATGSTLEAVMRWAASRWNVPSVQLVPPFYDHPLFIDASAEIAAPVLARVRPERVFFSFHGLPERHIRRADASRGHCLGSARCCDAIVPANRGCYRAQCHATARLIADRLGVPEERRIVCFQSRLGRSPWIRPYTDEVIVEEARLGCRRAVILSPAFVADCLETLEELGIRARASFQANGGEVFEPVPCLNATGTWADAVVAIAREATPWLGRPTGIASGAARES